MNNDYDGNISSGGFIGLLSLYLYHTIIEPALHLLLVISVFCQLIIIIYLGSLIYLMEDTSMINRISDAIEKQDAFSTCILLSLLILMSFSWSPLTALRVITVLYQPLFKSSHDQLLPAVS